MSTPNVVGTVTLASAQTFRMDGDTACNFTDVRVEAGTYDIVRILTRDGVRYLVEYPGRVSASFYRDRLGGHTSNEVNRGLGMPRIYRASMSAHDLACRVSAGLDAFSGTVMFSDSAAFSVVEQELPEWAKASRAHSLQLCLDRLANAIDREDEQAIEMSQTIAAQLSRPPKPALAFAIDA